MFIPLLMISFNIFGNGLHDAFNPSLERSGGMMVNILDVRNLIISFRTNNGTVKAVRDISFTIKRVNPCHCNVNPAQVSPVTARAIMGIFGSLMLLSRAEKYFTMDATFLKTPLRMTISSAETVYR